MLTTRLHMLYLVVCLAEWLPACLHVYLVACLTTCLYVCPAVCLRRIFGTSFKHFFVPLHVSSCFDDTGFVLDSFTVCRIFSIFLISVHYLILPHWFPLHCDFAVGSFPSRSLNSFNNVCTFFNSLQTVAHCMQ